MSFKKQHVCCSKRGQKWQSKTRYLFVSTLAPKCTYSTGIFCASEAISKLKIGSRFAPCLFFSAFEYPQYLPESCTPKRYVRYFMAVAAAKDHKKKTASIYLFLLWLQTTTSTLHVPCSQIKNEGDACLPSAVGNKYMLRNLMTLGLCSTYK